MCFVIAPMVMMGIMAATAAASAAVGAAGASAQADAAANAQNYQAQVADNNAMIAHKAAVAETNAGEAAVTQNQMQYRAMAGKQKASLAASGVDPNTGSAADVLASTDLMKTQDSLTIRSNYARQAYNFQVQGMSDTAQAGLDRLGASNAEMGGQIGVATSILGAANSFAGKWASWQMASGGGGGDPAGGAGVLSSGGAGPMG